MHYTKLAGLIICCQTKGFSQLFCISHSRLKLRFRPLARLFCFFITAEYTHCIYTHSHCRRWFLLFFSPVSFCLLPPFSYGVTLPLYPGPLGFPPSIRLSAVLHCNKITIESLSRGWRRRLGSCTTALHYETKVSHIQSTQIILSDETLFQTDEGEGIDYYTKQVFFFCASDFYDWLWIDTCITKKFLHKVYKSRW